MRRSLLALGAWLVLSACTTPPPSGNRPTAQPAPIVSDVLPLATPAPEGLSVQQLAAAQTAQAASGLSTQAAQEQTRIALAIQLATQNAQETESAHVWAMRQTSDAISMAQTQGAATVIAYQTGAALTESAKQATVSAALTQANLTATAEAHTRQTQAQTRWDNFWDYLSLFTAFGFVVLCLSLFAAIVYYFGHGLNSLIENMTKYLQAKTLLAVVEAEKARLVFREKEKQVFVVNTNGRAPELLTAPTEPEDASIERERLWLQGVKRFVMYADTLSIGFSYAKCGPEGAAILSRDDWTNVTDYLRDAGIIDKRPKAPIKWGEGWNYKRFTEEVAEGKLPPAPADLPPPTVKNPRAQAHSGAQNA